MKEFGVSRLLKKKEYPRYHKKKSSPTRKTNCPCSTGTPMAKNDFCWTFSSSSMVRNHEGYGFRYTELTGVTLTISGKQRKTLTVEISPRLAAEINNRRKRSNSEYLFPNRKGKPNQHLLRDLQDLAKKPGARFHTELNKLRKTGASRRYLKGVGLPTLMQELGHESLATTQDYLADVRRKTKQRRLWRMQILFRSPVW